MELPSDAEQGWGKLRPGSRCGLWASMSTDSVLCCRSPSEQGVSDQPCELGTLPVGPSFLICDRREVQAPPRRLVRWGGTVHTRAQHRAGRVSVGWTHWAASRQLQAPSWRRVTFRVGPHSLGPPFMLTVSPLELAAARGP